MRVGLQGDGLGAGFDWGSEEGHPGGGGTGPSKAGVGSTGLEWSRWVVERHRERYDWKRRFFP